MKSEYSIRFKGGFKEFSWSDWDHGSGVAAETYSGSGTVDFQEFVAALSAFSSKGGREEKMRCKSAARTTNLTASRIQGV